MTRVRAATEADVPTIASFFADASPHEGDAGAHAERLREELARAIARVTVAEDGKGAAVGALVAWHVADEVTLMDVAVDTRRRREGHGRALVEELLAWSRAHTMHLVLLEVRATNVAARTLYRTLGFEEVNVRRRYYADGEDAIEMHATVGVVG